MGLDFTANFLIEKKDKGKTEKEKEEWETIFGGRKVIKDSLPELTLEEEEQKNVTSLCSDDLLSFMIGSYETNERANDILF